MKQTGNSKLTSLALLLVLAVAGAAFGIWAGKALFGPSGPSAEELAALNTTLLPQGKPLTAFELADQQGRPFGLAQLQGKWSLLFFGYTNCPDIFGALTKRLADSPALLADSQFVFVSVDPQRDTAEQLKSYLGYFDPDFLGVSGSRPQIDALARQMGVAYFLNQPDKGAAPDNYTVDHSAAILLINPQGEFQGLFSTPHEPAKIAQAYRLIRAAHP